jgi:hypothetical protein
MGKPGAIFAFLHAVTTWTDGPAELRHLLLTLCVLCNHETHKGIYGQEAIGRAMGKAPRTVRWLLDQLEKHPTAPIRVNRRYRSRTDGRGRTSDEWTLELTGPTGNQLPLDSNDQPATHDRLDTQATGNPLPQEDTTGQSDQPAMKRRPTGNERHDQPATHCQGSAFVDQHLDQHVFITPPAVATPKVKKTKPNKGKTRAPDTLEPTEATQAVAKQYGRDCQSSWRECRDWAWSKNVMRADWQATLRNWMTPKDFQKGANGTRKPAIRQSGDNPNMELGESTFESKVVPIRKAAGAE